MDNLRDIAKEIARIYCPMTPLGVDMLAGILVPMKFQKGDTILKEGNVCNALYYVEKGMVRQYYYKNKKDVTEHFSFEGRIVFCIESLLKQEPSRLIVEALEQTTLYAIPYDTLLGLMVRNQEMEMLYRKILEHVAISSHFLQMTPETLSRVRGASVAATRTNPPRELTDPWWTRTNTK